MPKQVFCSPCGFPLWKKTKIRKRRKFVVKPKPNNASKRQSRDPPPGDGVGEGGYRVTGYIHKENIGVVVV
jgi:hypothetical protein